MRKTICFQNIASIMVSVKDVTPVGQTHQITIIEAGIPGREEKVSRSRLATANKLVDDLKGY